MKDKEKQIDCDTCLFKEMCFYQEEITDCNEWAKEFQCENYKPKPPEDSIVLSKAKYEMLIACSSYEGVMGKLKDEYIRGSKETAEKIYRMADEICTGSQNDGDKILAMIKDTFCIETKE